MRVHVFDVNQRLFIQKLLNEYNCSMMKKCEGICVSLVLLEARPH